MSILAGVSFLLAPEIAPLAVRIRARIEARTGLPVPEDRPAIAPAVRPIEKVSPPKKMPGPEKMAGPAAPGKPKEIPPSPPVPPPEPPLPRRYIPYQRLETARIFNGLQLEAKVQTEQGLAASKERDIDASYRVALDLRVNVPTPVDTASGLARLNPDLPRIIPGLAPMMEKGRVSDFFHGLYERKVAFLHDQVGKLDQVVSRHNFYDCETILELRHATSGRRALLIQGEMDVVADGSDGDRAQAIAEPHVNFQPFTSYRWKKRSETPNPHLADRKRRLEEAQKEFEIKGLGIERNRQLRATIEQMRREILEMQRYSFLVAALDPFIVVPGFTLRYPDSPYAPSIGDLAVVIHGSRAYPALVGDAGPSYKCGEASLRIAQTIDPGCDPYRRPVSDLSITYMVFPRTSTEASGPPDLQKLRQRCVQLLDEIGGFSGEVHDWAPPPEPPPIVGTSNMISTATTDVAIAPAAPAPAPQTNAPPPATTNGAASSVR